MTLFKSLKKTALILGLVLGSAAVALAAGMWTNSLPQVFPVGTTGNQNNLGGYGIGTGYTVLPLTGLEVAPFDTQLTSGQNPATELISTAQLKLYVPAPVVLNPATATPIAVDASLGDLYTVTLTGNGALANPTNLVAGKIIRFLVKQDSTGSRTLVYGNAVANNLYSWQNSKGLQAAPTLSTSAGAVDILTFIYNGTSLLGTSQLNFCGGPTTAC